jgi:cell division protein FtsI (penicillin-binding protein 3)
VSNFFSSSKELDERIGKKTKLLLLLFLFTLGILIFLGSILHTAIKERHIPQLVISETNRALRGDILSQDGFKLSFSQKLYKAMVNTNNIDPDKKELFIKLFSIYSGISEKKIRERVKREGNIVLSYSIDANRAKYLKELARKLRVLKVFVPYEDKKGHIIKYGLSLTESGESRIFSYKDSFEPILGFMKKSEDNGFTKPIGVKGLEKSYQEALRPIQNGTVKGLRDIGNSIILNGDSFVKPPINGMTLLLNIPMSLQKSVEVVLQKAKRELLAKEVVAIVMDSKTGKIRAMATSNRFNPSHIRKSDYPSLNVTAIEYTYEPGSVIKPITFSLLLQNHRVNPYDIIRTYNGQYKLGNKIITDEHREEWMSAENVIVYSSNIGIAQLAQRLGAIDFTEGFKKFGFTQKTGIDLPYEHVGIMPNTLQMENEIYKATIGYGYGIRTTLIQLVCAYNAFNNNGRIIEPKIVDTIIDHTGKRYPVEPFEEPRQAISPATATQMNKILQKVVKKGTGKKAITDGLIIGGKTGTAHIASKKGGYSQLYNSTFIGFANDKKHRFTIGVLVREPKKPRSYYASRSAVPVFKQIVNLLIEHGELIPEESNP